MSPPRSVLVVGASLAGSTAVSALRDHGFDGAITVVGDEPRLPYDRPPLSKAYLRGAVTDTALVTDPAAHGAQWSLGVPAVALDARTVTLADGRTLTADVCIIATGARARTLIGAEELAGVHTLRTVDDASALRTSMSTARRMVIVGAGFIGAEVASTAVALGIDVTVVEASTAPLAGPLGTDMADIVVGLHRRHGVTLLVGAAVDTLNGRDGRVSSVTLGDGRVLDADVVVVGIGSLPNTEWAAASGLAIDGGFVTDTRYRTTVPGVFAIGDCARPYDEIAHRHHRSEHWSGAVAGAETVARLVTGAERPRRSAPYFWSDQYGHSIQFAGWRQPTDSVRVIDGDPQDDRFVAVYERENRTVAVIAMDNPRLFTRLRKELTASAA